MIHAKFQDNRTISSSEDFKGFYHIYARGPSRSCDPNHWYEFVPLPNESSAYLAFISQAVFTEDV